MARADAKWKPAGSGEEELSWILFDVQSSTTTGNTTLNFFSRSEAAQNVRTTNMPSAGSLPPSQRFQIRRVYFIMDAAFNTATDESDVLDGGSLEITINRKRVLHGPLRAFLGPVHRLPPGVTDVDATNVGQKYRLPIYLTLRGGAEFNVSVITGDTNPTAAQQITVVLEGVLVRPQD